MNEYADIIIGNLETLKSEMDEYSYLYSRNPKKNFTRKRKLDFKEILRILLSMGGNSLNIELMECFSYDLNTTKSVTFVQQREKFYQKHFNFCFMNSLKHLFRIVLIMGTVYWQ